MTQKVVEARGLAAELMREVADRAHEGELGPVVVQNWMAGKDADLLRSVAFQLCMVEYAMDTFLEHGDPDNGYRPPPGTMMPSEDDEPTVTQPPEGGGQQPNIDLSGYPVKGSSADVPESAKQQTSSMERERSTKGDKPR